MVTAQRTVFACGGRDDQTRIQPRFPGITIEKRWPGRSIEPRMRSPQPGRGLEAILLPFTHHPRTPTEYLA